MKASRVDLLILLWFSLVLPACTAKTEGPAPDAAKVTVATVQSQAVTLTQPYVAQIRSHHRIEVRAPVAGYVVAVPIKEGQTVQRGDLLFQLRPVAEGAKPSAEGDRVISVTARFDGMVDRLRHQQGSLIKQGEPITTLADNSTMWVYFNVPEVRYLEYKSAGLDQSPDHWKIELLLADGKKFNQPGKLGAIPANFNVETGQIPFRADFANPDKLLRHGQAGTILISQEEDNAVVIPQRATFEVLGKRYVYVVDKDDVARQRAFTYQNEMDDIFVVKEGLRVGERIVVDGVREITDGDKVQYEH
ncbi:MAG TPA: efflux RND transporter periplasmic adaptor subunit [Pirellulales bacterium]|nr:efflux RND transporter periplasmic adaptor subunit [Pirellulales bacterium]